MVDPDEGSSISGPDSIAGERIEPETVHTDELIHVADYIVGTESELDTALSAATDGDVIISEDFSKITNEKTINNPIKWVHNGDINLSSNFIAIGTDNSKPTDGTVVINGKIKGSGPSAGEIFWRFVSGADWTIKAKRISHIDTLWDFQPLSRDSTEYYAGNELNVSGLNDAKLGWEIPKEPDNVKIEGNTLRATDVIKANRPVHHRGGAYNTLITNGIHAEAPEDDLNDVDSRGGNLWIIGYVENQIQLNSSSRAITSGDGSQLTNLRATNRKWINVNSSDGEFFPVLTDPGIDAVRLEALNSASGDDAGIMQFSANKQYDFLNTSDTPSFTIKPNGGFGERGFSNLAGTTGDHDGQIRNHDGSDGSSGTTVPKGAAQWDSANNQWISLVNGVEFR